MGVGRVPPQAAAEHRLLALHEVARAIAAGLPLDQVLRSVASVPVVVGDATTCWLFVRQKGGWRLAVCRGELAQELECRARASGTGTVFARARAGPVVLRSEEVDAADPLLGAFANRAESVILVPMQSARRIVGLLVAAVPPSSSPDVTFLAALAAQGAAAVECARQREENRAWRQRLEAALGDVSEAVLVYSGARRLALLNAPAQELLRGTHVRLGDSLGAVVRKADLRDAQGSTLNPRQTGVARALRGERVTAAVEVLPRPDGTACHLRADAVPLVVAGRVEGAVLVWRDTTDAQDALKAQVEFLAAVSHEIRNPLAAILSNAEILQADLVRGGPLREPQRRLETIVEQTRYVATMLRDLTDAARSS